MFRFHLRCLLVVLVLYCCRGKISCCSFDTLLGLMKTYVVTPFLYVSLHGLVFRNPGGRVHARIYDGTCRTLVFASTPISSSSSKRFPVLDVRRSSREASSASRAYSFFFTSCARTKEVQSERSVGKREAGVETVQNTQNISVHYNVGGKLPKCSKCRVTN